MANQTEPGQLPGQPLSQAHGQVSDRIVLRGGLAEAARLAPWVASLAARHRIDGQLEFAIHLCLEEAVGNILRHGYADTAAEPVTVEFFQPSATHLLFIVEDSAPPFNPLLAPEQPLLDVDGELAVGGRGIRLLRAFAHSLNYEPTAAGNRLRIAFTRTP